MVTTLQVNKCSPPKEGPEVDLQARNVKRCAIYIRVSTAEQRVEGWSLEAQKASLMAFAKSKGWKVVGIYADEGKTARKRLRDRRAIFQLLEDVKAGEVDVILFKELDRWFRSVSDFYKVQDVLDEYGVAWVSERQPTLGMATKEDRLQVNVLLSVGQNETDSTSDRIKYTNKYLRQQKRWTSGASTLPRGYTLDADQHVIQDPVESQYTLTLVDRVFQYGSVRKAVRETNAEFERKTLYNNAMSLLRNSMLYGEYMEVPDFVEDPLMTKERWDRLQSLVKRNARDTASRTYIFAGLLRCAECGTVMAGTYTNGRYKQYQYYRCRRGTLDGTCSNNVAIAEIKLQTRLMEYVQEAVADQIVKVKGVADARKKKKPRKNNRASIEKQLDKLEDVYISSDRMTKERYEQKKAAILAKLVEDDEPEEKLPALADLKKIQALFDSGVEELYKDFTAEERREFWRGILYNVKMNGQDIIDIDFIE